LSLLLLLLALLLLMTVSIGSEKQYICRADEPRLLCV
jgi:hypothetical protein